MFEGSCSVCRCCGSLQVLLGSSNSLSAEELVRGVAELMHLSLESPALADAVQQFRAKAESLAVNLDMCERQPTVLILDKVTWLFNKRCAFCLVCLTQSEDL